ncbi:hypothetical protein ACFU96_44285 [Streptomyces sp. NPDC057620]|uniref:hypothetical protein n=1 Tax=Streptomyces sp. NPDC057620 TaxID=3346185 RepID=UPI0036C15307
MTEQETRQMLPDVQRYVASVEAARETRNTALRAADAKTGERFRSTDDGRRQHSMYVQEVDKAYGAYAEAQEAAWQVLATSGDPLVKWVAENCAGYREQAECVLCALPATIAQLDALAEENGWCRVWDEFKQRAADAGVVPTVTPGTSEVPA